MERTETLVLNGSKPNRREIKEFVHALADPGILASTGGYLFKSRLDDGALHIGIVPAISEGERLHHYDIVIPPGEHILGSFSASGELTLLFRADKDLLDEDSRRRWRGQFRAFAEVLLDGGYKGRGVLDWITRQIIEESGIFAPVPATLKDIVSAPELP